VAALSEACGVALHPDRFRPNLIIGGGLPAWEEFRWVGREVRLGEATLRVISRTVRCEGINADARHGSFEADVGIPGLLDKHFPEHGPYLGVYAQVRVRVRLTLTLTPTLTTTLTIPTSRWSRAGGCVWATRCRVPLRVRNERARTNAPHPNARA
jgi:hypothetical protein